MLLEWLRPSPTRQADDPRPGLVLASRGLRRVATLPALLPEWQLTPATRAGPSAVLTWGPPSEATERLAQRQGLPLLHAEDGFLRSTEPGHRSPPLSIVLDDQGSPHDASRPSRLEGLIAAPLGAAQLERGARLRDAWVEARVSQCNHAPDGLPDALLRQAATDPPVLVIDQVIGDTALVGSGAGEAHFQWMLQAALDEHPRSPVWLKVHPDVIAGRRQGHFMRALTPAEAARVTLIADDLHPPALFDVCQAVYVVSAQAGFEALLHGRPVRCFGQPFYAGWGLTHDHLGAPSRRRQASPSVAALVHAALIACPRGLDPETGRLCEPERLLAHLHLQRQQRARRPSSVQVLGFSRWQRPIVRTFLQGSRHIEFLPRERQLDPATAVAVWGRSPAPTQATGPVLRLGDGLLHPLGADAERTRPLSWVIDDLGLHFDATRPSRLEHLLNRHDFDDTLRERARALRVAIVQAGLTTAWQRPKQGRRVVLVPGQVEEDAAIQWGCSDLRTNAALLQAVREAEPDAWVVHRPHPDVVARPSWPEACEQLRPFCDEIVLGTDLHTLLNAADAVHTLTSPTGFDALLHGRPVTTWGLPFYAGWGLTDDRVPASHPTRQRRQRRLQLDELVAAALILYPTYVSRHAGAYTTPEQALAEWREGAAPPSPEDSIARRAWEHLRRQMRQTLARGGGR